MSAVEIAQIALAVTAGLALAVAITQVWVTALNERRRTQPIVLTHQTQSRHQDPSPVVPGWRVEARIGNEGQGPAFNVRFGVAFYGVRFAYRMNSKDPYSGNRHRVLQPQSSEGPFVIDLGSIDIWGGEGVPEEENHFYWARYENAQGKTWETINPPDRSADLDIRRRRFIGLRERLEDRRRRRLIRKGQEVERKAIQRLTEGMNDSADE